MDDRTNKMAAGLLDIETVAVAALRDQPTDPDANRRNMSKALALIELKAHNARWRGAGSLPAAVLAEIYKHYTHAKTKHPYFCDGLTPIAFGGDPDEIREWVDYQLREQRRKLALLADDGRVSWVDVLNCEVWEINEALVAGDFPAGVRECYDAIAVLLRLVDVLQGRQDMGRPDAEGGAQ